MSKNNEKKPELINEELKIYRVMDVFDCNFEAPKGSMMIDIDGYYFFKTGDLATDWTQIKMKKPMTQKFRESFMDDLNEYHIRILCESALANFDDAIPTDLGFNEVDVKRKLEYILEE